MTPRTAASAAGFALPHTPEMANEFSSMPVWKNVWEQDSSQQRSESGRYFDASTVFVGGLEPSGPEGWDERRVAQVFGKYGKVESINFIRPCER